jgi:hypothetical protein
LIGNRSDEGIPNDMTALDEMQTLEFHLSRFVPDTVLTARALLGMAVEIMKVSILSISSPAVRFWISCAIA